MRKSKLLPVTRTIRYLQECGWMATRVDRKEGRIDRDFFGVADVLAIHPESGAVRAIQCTSSPNIAARIKKLKSDDLAQNMAALRKCNFAIEVWGWYANRDDPRIEDLS